MEITTTERTEQVSSGTEEKSPNRNNAAAFFGRLSQNQTQVSTNDTRARISVAIEVERTDPPEALMRVLESLTNACVRPVVIQRTKIGASESEQKAGLDSLAKHRYDHTAAADDI